jgi:hypothetical protein
MEENKSYRDFLEIVKIELGDFLRLSEAGRTIRHAALKARKKSIKIRQLLKEFRDISLDNDKRIATIISEAKKKINRGNI